MNEKDIKRQVKTHIFKETNGRILRILNILDYKERTVGSVFYVMEDVPREELGNSLRYLLDSGYIRIPDTKDAALLDVMEEENSARKLVITHTGMELLEGVKSNPAVDM